jgi:putative addiction module component (TIGR02574 family)
MIDFQRNKTLSKAEKMGIDWPMPITLDEIVEETRHMPPDVVTELVDRILVARHGGTEPGVAAAWKKEIGKRIEDIETGKVKGIPLEESLARIRKIAQK